MTELVDQYGKGINQEIKMKEHFIDQDDLFTNVDKLYQLFETQRISPMMAAASMSVVMAELKQLGIDVNAVVIGKKET